MRTVPAPLSGKLDGARDGSTAGRALSLTGTSNRLGLRLLHLSSSHSLALSSRPLRSSLSSLHYDFLLNSHPVRTIQPQTMEEPPWKRLKLSLERPYKDDNGEQTPELFDITSDGQHIYRP